MPVGRKLNVAMVEVNLPMFQAMFKKHGTMCEAPGCNPVQPAFAPYQSVWSFSFLCKAHYDHVISLRDRMRLAWERTLAEHMLSLLHRQSYTKSNINSGFLLEQAIAVREEAAAELDRLASRAEAKTRADLRRQIRESGSKPGIADDEILTPRLRQAARQQAGIKQPGPKPVNHRAILIPRLIVGTQSGEEG